MARQPRWATVAAAAGVILSLLTSGTAGQCQLAFTANPQLSTLSLGGGVVTPLPAPLVPTNPDAVLGLQGAAAAAVPGACPTEGAQAFIQQLDGAQLLTTAELGPLVLFPSEGIAVRGQVEVLSDPLSAALQASPAQPYPSCAGCSRQPGFSGAVQRDGGLHHCTPPASPHP